LISGNGMLLCGNHKSFTELALGCMGALDEFQQFYCFVV
jgi:hypothetical protein